MKWNLKPLNVGWSFRIQTRWLLKLLKKKDYINWWSCLIINSIMWHHLIKRSDLWHKKLWYVYMQTLITMERNNLVESMDLNEDHDLSFCNGCVCGKHHCTPFPFTRVLMQKKCWWDPFFCGDFEWWKFTTLKKGHGFQISVCTSQ